MVRALKEQIPVQLLVLLSDPLAETRLRAARDLAFVGERYFCSRRVVYPLIRCFKEDSDDEVRLTALVSLSKLGQDWRIFDLARAALSDGNAEIRRQALDVVCDAEVFFFEPYRAWGRLPKYDREDPEDVFAAAPAGTVVRLILSRLDDFSPSVRKMAVYEYGRLRHYWSGTLGLTAAEVRTVDDRIRGISVHDPDGEVREEAAKNLSENS